MATQRITVNATGAASPADPPLHRSSNNGDNAVQWQSASGTHTISNLPTGVFSPEPPSSITVSPGSPSPTYTVLSSATDGDYEYQIDDGSARAQVRSGVGEGSKPSIKVQP